jgi:hypothetical protein
LPAGLALAKAAPEHQVLAFAITVAFTIIAASQDFGSAMAFVARADIANQSVDRESAPRTTVQVPSFDAGLGGFH